MVWKGVIHHYREYLPVNKHTPIITLQEGNTPLLKAENLERFLDSPVEIFLKYEGVNPTGSFKDRGMTMAISKALEDGAKAVMCASTGNTSASAAAYASRANLKCVVLIPSGAIALGKLAQALIHGARVLAVEGNFDQALSLVREITSRYPIALVNSLNPYRIEGQKTGAFEICDQLGCTPDYHFIPVGNAGNITAYWKGYREYQERGKIKELPRMMGFQAEGAAPIVKKKVIIHPQTIATAIRIGNPARWKEAEEAIYSSRGLIDTVNDEEILEAYHLLSSREGIFVEPASAASVAGLIKLLRKGFFRSPNLRGKVAVCVLTGHGLKDPQRAMEEVKPPPSIPPEIKVVLGKIEDLL